MTFSSRREYKFGWLVFQGFSYDNQCYPSIVSAQYRIYTSYNVIRQRMSIIAYSRDSRNTADPSRRSRMLEDSASRVRPRHVDPGKVGADTGRLTEVGFDKFSASQRSVGEVRLGEVSARKVGLVDFSPGKIRLDEGCSSKVSLFEVSLGEVSLGEVSRVKASLGEVSSSEVSFDKIRLGEIGPGKVSPTEIWPYVRVRRSPLIPDRYSLHEHLDV